MFVHTHLPSYVNRQYSIKPDKLIRQYLYMYLFSIHVYALDFIQIQRVYVYLCVNFRVLVLPRSISQ